MYFKERYNDKSKKFFVNVLKLNNYKFLKNNRIEDISFNITCFECLPIISTLRHFLNQKYGLYRKVS